MTASSVAYPPSPSRRIYQLQPPTERLCIQCGIGFLSRKKSARFCSAACRARRARGVQRLSLSCRTCGNVFIQKSSSHQCCTKKCYETYRRNIRKVGIEYTCLLCQKQYGTYRGGTEGRQFCSRACSDEWVRQGLRTYQCTCLTCGESFPSKCPTARTCQACKVLSIMARNAAKKKPQHPCVVCSTLCSSQKARPMCSYACHLQSLLLPVACVCQQCGEHYQRAYRKRSAICSVCATVNAQQAVKNGRRKRRLRERTQRRVVSKKGLLTLERFSDTDIFERDGWVCQLCRRKISKDVATTHPRYATIDHIIPLSKDGEHSRRNVQAACRACNIRKSNTIGSGVQMLLLG